MSRFDVTLWRRRDDFSTPQRFFVLRMKSSSHNCRRHRALVVSLSLSKSRPSLLLLGRSCVCCVCVWSTTTLPKKKRFFVRYTGTQKKPCVFRVFFSDVFFFIIFFVFLWLLRSVVSVVVRACALWRRVYTSIPFFASWFFPDEDNDERREERDERRLRRARWSSFFF